VNQLETRADTSSLAKAHGLNRAPPILIWQILSNKVSHLLMNQFLAVLLYQQLCCNTKFLEARARMERFIILLLVFTGHVAIATSSNIDSESIETIVVTASRLELSKTSVTPSADVITSEQIEERNPASATELLRQFSGVNVTQQGGRGGVTSVVVRGGESNFTVVLIDGVKVNDSTNTRGGSYNFSNLDLSNVTRVELVRGPLSSLYGSDALAGVINIITTDKEPGGRLWIQAGSDEFLSASGHFSKQFGATLASLNLHAVQDDADIEGASYEDWGLSGDLRSELGDRSSALVMFRYQQSQSTSYPEDSGGSEFAEIRDVDNRESSETHLRLAWDYTLSGGWQFNAAGSRYERDESFSSPGIAPALFSGVPPNSADTEFSRDQIVATLKRRFGEAAAFAVGAEWQSESGNSIGVLDLGFPVPTDFQLERNTNSAFSEISVSAGPLTVQGGLRWDDVDSIHNETTARIGVLYQLSDGRSDLRANWGQGFKAPSFFALAHPLVGNPALRSEFANSVDLIFIRRLAREGSELRLGLYKNEYKDLIDFDPDLFTNVNRSKVVIQGFELDLALSLNERLDLQGHLTYSDSDIRDSDAELRGWPNWRGGIIVDWMVNERWRLLSSFLILSEFFESSIPTGSVLLDGYERVDVSATWQACGKLSMQFAIDNLLDSEYQEAVGFPAAGIRGRIGVRYVF
jgi:iron complex outermembrane receptor protein/vitamin B12 transporter